MSRLLLVSDIHGHFAALQHAVRRAGFSSSRDRLIVLGDMVDRGPDSRMVVRWIRDHATRVIRGNHEEMWVEWAQTRQASLLSLLRQNGGSATLASYGSLRDFLEDIAWFETLSLSAHDQGRVMVHAGLRPYLPLASQNAEDLL